MVAHLIGVLVARQPQEEHLHAADCGADRIFACGLDAEGRRTRPPGHSLGGGVGDDRAARPDQRPERLDDAPVALLRGHPPVRKRHLYDFVSLSFCFAMNIDNCINKQTVKKTCCDEHGTLGLGCVSCALLWARCMNNSPWLVAR